jgi:putative DNA primase/helicase
MDGAMRRAPVAGARKGTLDGAYWARIEGLRAYGFMQNHRTGERRNWACGREAGQPTDPAFREMVEKRRLESLQEREREAQAAAARAESLEARMKPAVSEFPYVSRKGLLGAHGALLSDGRDWPAALAVPMRAYGEDGLIETRGLQFISEDGSKRFLKGSAKKGAFFLMGDASEAPALLVCEGFATGATLREATGLPVAVAFDAGNMEPVAVSLVKAHPGLALCLCADDDRSREDNVGIAKAMAAAEAVGGYIAVPRFPEGSPGTDFNDMIPALGRARAVGLIRDEIASALMIDLPAPLDASACSSKAGSRGSEPSASEPRR